MIDAPQRLKDLEAQTTLTGIDFIFVHKHQKRLDVYFLVDPTTLSPALTITLDQISIYSPSGVVAPIPVILQSFVVVQGYNVLRLHVDHRGDFSLYNLKIDNSSIDPFYNDVSFSFKANCPSDLDCKPVPEECPPDNVVDFPIDYSARDFWSFRRALLEFASLRYPDWPDRLAADAGVMLAEVMSAAGDEMAYYQDRIGREAYLETATQKRSVRQHAQLVDYTMRDTVGAFAWIDLTVSAAGKVPAGTSVWAQGEDDVSINFEIGQNLKEALDGIQYAVDPLRNQYDVYRWDEDQSCLPVGSTKLFLNGHHATDLVSFDGSSPDNNDGKWVLLKTQPSNPAQQARALMVRLISVTDMADPLEGKPITEILWDETQASPWELDLTILIVRANVLPSTAGKTVAQYLIISADAEDLGAAEAGALNAMAFAEGRQILRAIEREGSNEAIIYRGSLTASEKDAVVYLRDDALVLTPEVYIDQLKFIASNWTVDFPWRWRPALVGVNSSSPVDTDFALDDGTWRRVVGYWRNGVEIVHQDYASGNGSTVRFGDGEFGLVPAEQTVFRISYRTGGGKKTNVSPGAIRNFDNAALAFISSCTNPLVASDGADPESLVETKQSAPDEFRTITYRAVRPEDYAEAAERLPWVQKAGASFRWTGSWLSAFATPDPKNSVIMTGVWRKDLVDQLDRFRQAGREVYTMDPLYADIDLDIDVCVAAGYYQGEVRERILIELFGKTGFVPAAGFFSPDRFTFGDSLERSALEAVIQSVPGVRAIESIQYRRRGFFAWKLFEDYYYDPGKNAIIRIENDPLHPERGILKLHLHGGS